jgi:acetylornithine deacetylase
LLARLVAFDTTSERSNLALIAFVREYLAGHGIEAQLVPAPDGQPNAGLYATIGPAGEGGIGLSGHTDCVPVAGQSWQSDPFGLIERQGRLYGRGTADMKGFLACALASVPAYRTLALKTPIHLLLSYDEEVGCKGVRPMIAELGGSLSRPRLVVVGEPTSMNVVDAHKGANRFEVEVIGEEAHSSLPHLGVNAVMVAARMIGELERIEAAEKAQARSARFTPDYTSLQVGLIAGGTSANIVPRSCRFSFDVRALPGADPLCIMRTLEAYAARELLPAMRSVSPTADICVRPTNLSPAFAAAPGSEAVALAMRLAGRNETLAVSYGTEAGLFQEGGCDTVICGPGDIAQAHKPDEFVEVAELDRCMAFLARLGSWAAG